MTENIAPPPAEHVLDATGHMHVVDAPIDLSHYTLEAWISLAFFWVLASDIFYQFFTRYVLNDSASWTEEIARYLLICTVSIAMAGSALVYILLTGDLPPFVVVHRMISGIDSFPLLAVPFFILAGNLMNNAGITNRIYNFALSLVGWLKGGLGHVNIIGSVIFAGMSGTAIADAAGLGTIEIKAMKDQGYDLGFSVGVTAASATLGPIIPPSLPFVIYGMMANVSVGQLFVAGIVPGLVMAVLMMLTVVSYAHKYLGGGDVQFEWHRMGKAFLELAIVVGFPLALWGLISLGTAFNVAVGIGLLLLLVADWKWKFDAVMPIMTPVLLIGGMSTGV